MPQCVISVKTSMKGGTPLVMKDVFALRFACIQTVLESGDFCWKKFRLSLQVAGSIRYVWVTSYSVKKD